LPVLCRGRQLAHRCPGCRRAHIRKFDHLSHVPGILCGNPRKDHDTFIARTAQSLHTTTATTTTGTRVNP
jgi:hypothetical protein